MPTTYTLKAIEWEEDGHARNWPESKKYRGGVVDGVCELESPRPGLRETWKLRYRPNSGPGSFEREFPTREEAEAYAWEECVMYFLRGWLAPVT